MCSFDPNAYRLPDVNIIDHEIKIYIINISSNHNIPENVQF